MEKFFRIGALNISLTYDASYNIPFEKALEAFGADALKWPDIRFRIDAKSTFPPVDSCRRIFTANPDGLWTILEDQEKAYYLIVLQNVMSDREPYRIIKADRTFSNFIIYDRPSKDNLLFSLEYPLADLAISGYLNINNIGIILHSACISIKEKGCLFAGVSGSGKSTISGIWRRDGEAEVLTDERVILRELNNKLWAFGTPWHGTEGSHKNTGAPVEKLFFIRHGKVNKAVPITATDAANRLVVRCFPTFWNKEGMEFALEFCTRAARAIASYELEFVPDFSVTEYLKKMF